MGRLLTTREFIKKARKVHGNRYDYSESNYSGIGKKLVVICRDHGPFRQTASDHCSGCGCPACAGRKPITIQEMHNLAKLRGGTCLSNKYVNSDTKLLWRCAHGHEWWSLPQSVKRGDWCQKCYRLRAGESQRLTIEDMDAMAIKRGGTCLTREYRNKDTNLLWRCVAGHEWRATPGSIRQGSWCRKCAGLALSTLDEMVRLAAERGGQCLSPVYTNGHTPLFWRCSAGHQWRATPANVGQGHWCPYCSRYLNERICRGVVETLFQKEFPRKRPEWLKRPQGRKMELDGYCESLQLAFEYNGEQHYSEIKHFHGRGGKRLDQQQRDDLLKAKLCREYGVQLFTIPYTCKPEDIADLIRAESKKHGIHVPWNGQVDWEALPGIYSPEHLKEMQTLAARRGGQCLSKVYVTNYTKLLWRCAQGHKWWAVPYSIQAGKWCPDCSRLHHMDGLKKTREDMDAEAAKRGGRCLSEAYVNSSTKLLWRCAKGHEWWATQSQIHQGAWCPKCASKCRAENQTLTIEDMQAAAVEHGGQCVSNVYRGCRIKLLWRCSKGHEWRAVPYSVRQGHWCATCGHEWAGKKKSTKSRIVRRKSKSPGHR